MNGFWKEHPVGGIASVLAIALAAAIVVQYARGAWPFAMTPRPAAPATSPPAPDGPHAGHGPATDQAPPSRPPGYASVTLDERQARALGLTTQPVTEREFTRQIRTVGVVTADDTRTAHVHTRVRGWIESIHGQFVGRTVRSGQRLASIYSQEVYAAQLELAALVHGGGSPSTALVEAARRRLELLDVPTSMIAKVVATGKPQRTFPVNAPRSGVVVAMQAAEGLYVDPSIELYTISDLSRVWVLADLYEADVPHVALGAQARLTLEGRRRSGRREGRVPRANDRRANPDP